MSYRLIAIDLDGTLLNGTKQITPRTREVLTALTLRGKQIVIATGRPFAVLAIYCAGLPLTAPQITLNGAVIHNPISGQDMVRTPLPAWGVQEALRFFREVEVPVALFAPGTIYLDARIPEAHSWSPAPLPPPIRFEDIGEVSDREVLKVAGHAEPAEIARLQPRADRVLGDRLYVTRTAPRLLEVLHRDVSKGAALHRIAAELEISRDEIVAIGDDHNDLTMFAYAGLSVAMSTASREVKAAAHIVTGSSEEDGVAQALEGLA